MEHHAIMARAAETTVEVLRNVKPDQLTAPTPCGDWDVRALVNHLMLWSAFRSERAARKLPADESMDEGTDLTDGDWQELYASQVDKAVTAWARPGAWEGVTGLAGGEFPAEMIGKMMIGEYVVHGWDLAVATGRQPGYEDVAEATFAMVAETAEQAREMGLFAASVPLQEDASWQARLIASTGRDPKWTPTPA